MLTETCVIFFYPPEPFKALFCEVIYRRHGRQKNMTQDAVNISS